MCFPGSAQVYLPGCIQGNAREDLRTGSCESGCPLVPCPTRQSLALSPPLHRAPGGGTSRKTDAVGVKPCYSARAAGGRARGFSHGASWGQTQTIPCKAKPEAVAVGW